MHIVLILLIVAVVISLVYRSYEGDATQEGLPQQTSSSLSPTVSFDDKRLVLISHGKLPSNHPLSATGPDNPPNNRC